MHFPLYSNGSFNSSPGSGPPNQTHLQHLQQNHVSHSAPPPPPPVQQAYMYPPPPPPASSSPQAQLISMPGTTQSYTNLSYLYPSYQGETQSTHGSSQQFHCQLPPVSILPPPPPLPPGTMLPAQALPNSFQRPPSYPLSVSARSLEPPGMPLLPPPPPRSADTACEKVSLNGIEGSAVEHAGSSKESSIDCDESSLPLVKAEHGSLLCTDPDIEMEDDITQPEIENYPRQPLNCGSDQVPQAYLNTEQPHPQRISAETNFLTELPGSKSYALIHQDTDDGSRQASSSPYSGRAKIVPECVLSDMYDPFVDSFEPATVKLDCVQEHEPANDTVAKPSISSNRPLIIEENNQGVDKQALSESDMTARVSVSSNKPPEVEEITTGNNIGTVVSGDNNEFGENAENKREDSSHETRTPNSHNDNTKANNNRGEPKEKESSRSMKLFQAVLTKFVKDLLKPSWRQGNMSKEAFKTIVKRAVEKVSKSMEGRRLPKSKAKIDKYINSSQQKLTKLVMGYVDKYVKA